MQAAAAPIPMFAGCKPIIGMIHALALPGTPRSRTPLPEIARHAAGEAALLRDAGVDALLIENMHDAPYLNGAVGPEIVAAMTAVGLAVRQAAPLPLGVQVLAAANREALAVALACGAEFVRVENFVYSHVADEGLMPVAQAGPLLRYRREIGAEHIAVFADIKKKHASHAITADVSLADTAHAARFFGADALVVTGRFTGDPADAEDARAARAGAGAPIVAGSGTTPANLAQLWEAFDGFIVGSSLKAGGVWSNPIDAKRLEEFMREVRRLRNG